MFPAGQRFGKVAVTSQYSDPDRPEVRTLEAKLPVVFSVLAPRIPACLPATQTVWRDKHPADFDRAEAQVLGVSPSSAYELMHEPGFPVLRIGSRMVVPKEQFIQWVTEHTEGGNCK